MNDKEIAKDILARLRSPEAFASLTLVDAVRDRAIVETALKQFINPPTAVISYDGTGVIISAYPYDHPRHEMNHMVVADVSQAGKVNRDRSFENVVRNILVQCGLQVVFD